MIAVFFVHNSVNWTKKYRKAKIICIYADFLVILQRKIV